MQGNALNTAIEYFSDTLNRKSVALQSQNLNTFLTLLSQLLQHNNLKLRIDLKVLGKNCLHCGMYIKLENLKKAIPLPCSPLEHFFCGAECLKRHALMCTNNTLLELEFVRCPGCRKTISYDIINEAFQGRIQQLQNDACDRALNMLLDDETKAKMKPKFTCQICFGEYDIEEGITLDCDHRFCINCIKMQIEMLIDSAQVSDEKLKCPNCPQPISVYEIEEIVGPELFEKYEKFKLRGLRLDKNDENGMIFHCLGADCEYICIVEKGETEFECPRCKFKCCPSCKEDTHKGSTCEEYKQWKKENSEADKLFDELIEQEGMLKCPECGAAVQRISGCQYMVCSSPQCQGRTYFCYDCGIKLAGDHAPHDCKPRWKANQQPQQPGIFGGFGGMGFGNMFIQPQPLRPRKIRRRGKRR
ncbi:unnamed protein product [Blepharisma stoltei]|uniref:RBR-type E3 ubiquitin transferase n=1 Tax=Blepharisma stoltei TaxID=1481888 RepID=A0AAU9JL37_9CILI|nr:unnamed protein product [Blepharisma stoltei]